ncbi:PDZ domain-containing protein [Elusimicrobiota bacterium]
MTDNLSAWKKRPLMETLSRVNADNIVRGAIHVRRKLTDIKVTPVGSSALCYEASSKRRSIFRIALFICGWFALLAATSACNAKKSTAKASRVDSVTKASPQMVPYVTDKKNFVAAKVGVPGADFSQLVAQVKYSVVSIGAFETIGNVMHFRSRGSGVIVDVRGYILTSHQAIEGNPDPRVVLFAADHTHQFEAQIVADDPRHNLALLRIYSPELFSKASMGNAAHTQSGEWALAMGSVDGLNQTVIPGLIDSTSRSIAVGNRSIKGLMHVSLKGMSAGMIGGPLFNIDGLLIGINMAQGIVLPIAQAEHIMNLVFEGQRDPGSLNQPLIAGAWAAQTSMLVTWLGAEVLPVDKKLAAKLGVAQKGLLVNRVAQNSPAAKSGIARGDVITKFNRKKVSSVKKLGKLVGRAKPGEAVIFEVVRRGEKSRVSVTLETKPRKADRFALPSIIRPRQVDWLGIELANITPEYMRRFAIDPSQNGVVIIGVENLVRQATGLEKGDLIRKANGKSIADIDGFMVLAASAQKGILLDIVRAGTPLYITVEPR